MEKEKAVMFWSGGKDSAFALYKILRENKYRVAYLLTTVNENFKRISMHGVREDLLDEQARSIGIPLLKMYVREASNAEYEKNMEIILVKLKAEGINKVLFGDIFLEDLKKYRDDNLSKLGMEGIYPLWKKDTGKLINEFIDSGFKTITCCVNDACFDESGAGKEVNREFIAALPENIDPCGENGEFHTFCFDGPVFKYPVPFKIGEKIYKPLEIKFSSEDSCTLPASSTKGFWFCDLLVRD